MTRLQDYADAFEYMVRGDASRARAWVASAKGEARLAVYRNNRAVAIADALCSNYPAVMTLVGRDFMRALAVEYARSHPPASPVLALYGDAFPDFIQSFPPLGNLPYLADIARLDRAWVEAFFAPDTDCSAPQTAPAASNILQLTMRARLLTLSWSVHDLWQASRAGLDPPASQLSGTPQHCLVWRGPDGMQSRVLDPDTARLLGEGAHEGACNILAELTACGALAPQTLQLQDNGETSCSRK